MPGEGVIQDEYTHDVIFVAPDGSARVARGWTPTASALQDGERVLGHAACLVSAAR